MKNSIIVCLLILMACKATAQHLDTTALRDSIAAGIAKMNQAQAHFDSMQKVQLERLQADAHVSDSINMVRGLDEYMRNKKEQDAKMVKALWIKGSFFVVMLAVTIVGLVRRRRQKVKG